MVEKSPEAFRTISEVADFLEIPAHVLRFWETRFPQIKPVKRAGGRRYYRPGDVALLAGIRQLLHDDGLTIRGAQKILRERGVRHVATLGGLNEQTGWAGDSPPLPDAVIAGLPEEDPMEEEVSNVVALTDWRAQSEPGSVQEPRQQSSFFDLDAFDPDLPPENASAAALSGMPPAAPQQPMIPAACAGPSAAIIEDTSPREPVVVPQERPWMPPVLRALDTDRRARRAMALGALLPRLRALQARLQAPPLLLVDPRDQAPQG